MISKSDLDQLIEREPVPGSPVLSVYLDVDQSKAVNLNRHFEVALKAMLRSIKTQLDEAQAKHFAADAERVEEFVSSIEPQKKSVVTFSDVSGNLFWAREINAPVRNDARWSNTAYILPLLELLDEYERYGVALVDKERARLFTVFMGEIEEHREAFAPAEVRHIKTTGTDHMLSQMHFQRKAEMHVRWNLKYVAELFDKLVDRYGFDRLVLAGPVEAVSELYHLLPKRLCARVVGRFHLPVNANEREVLAETLKIEEQVERQQETQLVEELIAGDPGKPVRLGLDPTLLALIEKRIWRLVYADGFRPRGGECGNCSTLYSRTDGACDYCTGTVQPVADLVERIVERVLESDGKVEEVKGEAADRLRRAGGIGAILRF
jgi:peptide chain release factor subunit 1